MNLIHGVRRKTVQSLGENIVLKSVQEEMIEKLDQEVEVCYVVGFVRLYDYLESDFFCRSVTRMLWVIRMVLWIRWGILRTSMLQYYKIEIEEGQGFPNTNE
jgi:hypothetical protein